jgi:hypothetical protein
MSLNVSLTHSPTANPAAEQHRFWGTPNESSTTLAQSAPVWHATLSSK